ncbi:conjugative relaxase-like TrwC/TraI family protein [Nocardioides sp. BE266]|uniref:MobF family relaxase n=1 Tax=Nocardioides sp. BE266 TaxID=2817725 RepID=UPI0028664541|nr:MobF family relaxase [Nocardioides sp. BE266]MDR7254192.1 conjugative relaxase-like TrwC/TraI family protein [Nocardioides sp. BE266]
MSLHKLTAGSGYDYLTRQVAALDATDKGHVGLASYYTEKGETPGVWMGSGMAGIDGLDAGEVVTAEQMQNLFGAGHHPLATDRTHALDVRIGRPGLPRPTEADYRTAARLGAPFKVYDHDVSAFRTEVAKRLAALNSEFGVRPDWAVPAAERARVRTEVARDFFRAEHGRDPSPGPDGARELAATIAKHSRPKTTAVAGYDLTFSPVKSVSTLWAIADPTTAAAIERAHQAAVDDALTFLETTALYTREGANGVRQVDVRGLVATAFTHRDSRAGDPDLHTHVAVANKVETLTPRNGKSGAGKWLAIDGRPLHKAIVSASETYNTALERHLTDTLGVRFEERPDTTTGGSRNKRPVREILGVDPRLNARFSKRRASVEARRAVLAGAFQATHGRPPTPVETLQLAQQATLETRDAKHEPRSLAEQREAWNREAIEVLGTPAQVAAMVRTALNPTHIGLSQTAGEGVAADSAWFAATADRITTTLEQARSTWQYWHVYAEAQRQVRSATVPTHQVARAVDLLVGEVLDTGSVSLARPAISLSADADGIVEPDVLRRADGTSVYSSAGSELYASERIMAAEQRLVDAAGRRDGHTVDASTVDLALLESTANGVTLNAGQATLVREMATSGARLQLAIAPAGSGKTTAMRALARAWTDAGGTIVGLAPSAAAADALRTAITSPPASVDGSTPAPTAAHTGVYAGVRTETLAMLTHALQGPDATSGGSAAGPLPASTPHPPAAVAGMPEWVADIGPTTLVVIDEAGMADTLSLDTAVSYVLERGGSVRLIGDNQQLTAIGAGGVLRDIQTTHGALQLSELVRFTDPAEGAASLALRDGRTEALGFYLDRQRIHVGNLTALSEDIFDAWLSDSEDGRDSIMLAPTRELVSDLNRRARAHRLHQSSSDSAGSPRPIAGPTARLGDDNDASTGDLIITRENDRRLRTFSTDWVKNGDRWTVLRIHDNGDLTARHIRNHRTIRLPHDYVARATGLGYACTVHAAQGVTADTMHGLATGAESRQQLYTMLTRGSAANHLYLQIVGDGDPHTVIHPTLIHPRTPTDILERVLARDDTQHSATSLLHQQADPALRLGLAAQRYLDSLHVAAEDILRRHPAASTTAEAADDRGAATGDNAPARNVVEALDVTADLVVPGLSDEPAWPTLRAHLLLLAADGHNPVALLTRAATAGELNTATDRAAVLDWRLDIDTATASHATTRPPPLGSPPSSVRPGPMPWMPGIPRLLAEDSQWGRYLTQRAQLLETLVADVRAQVAEQTSAPVWAQNGVLPNLHAICDVEVWRAAMQVADDDRRPTGPRQLQKAAATYQRQLVRAITAASTPALSEWRHLLVSLAPQIHDDDFTPLLAERLAAMSRASLPAHQLLRNAASTGSPLPDDHAAAALWWRMARHLTPAVAAHIVSPDAARASGPWSCMMPDLLGVDLTERIRTSTWWPALVTNIDHAIERGWRLEDLLGGRAVKTVDGGSTSLAETGMDECQVLVWHTSIALDPVPDEKTVDDQLDPPPADLWSGVEVDPGTYVQFPADHDRDFDGIDDFEPVGADTNSGAPAVPGDCETDVDSQAFVEPDLTMAGLVRDLSTGPLELTSAELRVMFRRAEDWYLSPVTRERMLQVNELAQSYFEANFNDSWGRRHLHERVRVDLAGDAHFRPGHAPAGWTKLVDHLRTRGVTDAEMLAAGLASTSSRGHLFDRFRDRLILPITHHDEILGFVGRRHPDLADDQTHGGKVGPKYLNTPNTPLFHKGAHLYGASDDLIIDGAIPVIVEGPIDAIAVTLATAGRYLGLAPLGTALTDEQARQVVAITRATRPVGMGPAAPVIATDADLAGQVAAERDYWILTPHGLDPTYARLPLGLDPAAFMTSAGPAALTAALDRALPLGDRLITERLANLPPDDAYQAATRVLAARPRHAWTGGADRISTRLDLPQPDTARALRDAVKAWNLDPRQTAQLDLANVRHVQARMQTASTRPPAQRWAPLAHSLDTRLVGQPDWPVTADAIQRAEYLCDDVETTIRIAIGDSPLDDRPARDLRYRLAAILDTDSESNHAPETVAVSSLRPDTDRTASPTARAPEPPPPQR